ncbi:f-box domain [Pyrenophora seminiperda CCB06]|uniref:F-box domain n=1 Tax=Pyrenophora seminiperda CCB06 TaxID=1302712 RepID=A0A3M7M5R7_9PLEO|nr:f-box domain [Pyrenophora seminiperda CCB06]
MLYEISRDPLAAQYIESLNLWDRRQLITSDFNDFRANGEAMEGIKDIVIGSECLDNAGVDADK